VRRIGVLMSFSADNSEAPGRAAHLRRVSVS